MVDRREPVSPIDYTPLSSQTQSKLCEVLSGLPIDPILPLDLLGINSPFDSSFQNLALFRMPDREVVSETSFGLLVARNYPTFQINLFKHITPDEFRDLNWPDGLILTGMAVVISSAPTESIPNAQLTITHMFTPLITPQYRAFFEFPPYSTSEPLGELPISVDTNALHAVLNQCLEPCLEYIPSWNPEGYEVDTNGNIKIKNERKAHPYVNERFGQHLLTLLAELNQ